MPRQGRQGLFIDRPGEEPIGFGRLECEQLREVPAVQITRVRLEELPGRTAGTPGGVVAGGLALSGHHTIPSWRPTRPNTSRANRRSSCVCVAVTMVRTRALSRATVGYAMPCANTPR